MNSRGSLSRRVFGAAGVAAFAATALVGITTSEASAQALTCATVDNFDRPNSAELVAPWKTLSGTQGGLSLSGGRAAVPPAPRTAGVSLYGSVAADSICADVFDAAGGSYSAGQFALRVADVGHFVSISVEDQDGSGTFDHVAFQANGGSFADPQTLPTPFASARVQVSITGTFLTVLIDTTFDGQADQTLVAGGAVPSTGGTEVGLVGFGLATFDNFGLPPAPTPQPAPVGKTIYGTAKKDVIQGTPGDDIIYAGGGNDVVYGNGGNDVIKGGAGNDKLYGGDGNDVLKGGKGTDKCDGGTGTDSAARNCEKKVAVP